MHDLLHQLVELLPLHPRDLESAHQLIDDHLSGDQDDPKDDVSRETSSSDPADPNPTTPAKPAFRPAGA